jgi:hypothetical protein
MPILRISVRVGSVMGCIDMIMRPFWTINRYVKERRPRKTQFVSAMGVYCASMMSWLIVDHADLNNCTKIIISVIFAIITAHAKKWLF